MRDWWSARTYWLVGIIMDTAEVRQVVVYRSHDAHILARVLYLVSVLEIDEQFRILKVCGDIYNSNIPQT